MGTAFVYLLDAKNNIVSYWKGPAEQFAKKNKNGEKNDPDMEFRPF